VLLLLQGDESGGVGSTDAGPTVLHGLARDRELAQIVSNHLRLDLDLMISCSWFMSRSWSRSTPRYVNFLKVLFFFKSTALASSAMISSLAEVNQATLAWSF
jgi:hypothetical protein